MGDGTTDAWLGAEVSRVHIRISPPWSVPVFLALAGCSGSSAGGAPPVHLDQATVTRDPASAIPQATLSGAVAANNAFGVDLYAQVLASSSTSNVLTSPLSASLALTMTYAGAVGPTASQMATALHYGSAAGSIFDGQNVLTQALAGRAASALASDEKTVASGSPAPSAGDYQLQVVNSIWGEQTYTWEPPFLALMARSYGTGVYVEDFVHGFDQARLTINDWVSFETADKINDLLPAGSLTADTRMVLVNAVHLKLPWATPFKVSSTAASTFTVAGGASVSTPFMNEQEVLPYVDDGQAQIVALPFSGGQVSVVIALPHGDLATYEAALAVGSAALAQPTTSTFVTLSLPKVSFTSPSFSLASALKAMGMTQAFDPAAADFTGLCAHPPDGRPLYIDDVLQKATVVMQETGVVAAAATAVSVTESSGSESGTPMLVNRPYVVAIVDVPTGAVLFLGHIVDPTQTGSP